MPISEVSPKAKKARTARRPTTLICDSHQQLCIKHGANSAWPSCRCRLPAASWDPRREEGPKAHTTPARRIQGRTWHHHHGLSCRHPDFSTPVHTYIKTHTQETQPTYARTHTHTDAQICTYAPLLRRTGHGDGPPTSEPIYQRGNIQEGQLQQGEQGWQGLGM